MKYLFTGIVAVIIGGMIGFTLSNVLAPSSSNTGNVITQSIVPRVNTSLTVPVGPQAVTTLATGASNCTTRIIGTASTSVMLSFSSSITPSATIGYWQPSSSTLSYDNAVYGCGSITAYSPASSTITVTSMVQ